MRKLICSPVLVLAVFVGCKSGLSGVYAGTDIHNNDPHNMENAKLEFVSRVDCLFSEGTPGYPYWAPQKCTYQVKGNQVIVSFPGSSSVRVYEMSPSGSLTFKSQDGVFSEVITLAKTNTSN